MRGHGRVFIHILLQFLLVPSAFAEIEAGRIAVVNGDVRISKGESDRGTSAKPNDLVMNNDVIKTGQNGSAKVLFTDQSIMDIGQNSAFKVSDYALKNSDNRTGTFLLLYGKIRALVTKKVGEGGKVEVRSGTTVMGVRGTEFVVERTRGDRNASAGEVAVMVISGTLQVRNGDSPAIAVTSGQMLAANQRSVSKVGSDQMRAAVSAAKAEDHTFTSAVTIASSGGGQSSVASMAVSSLISAVVVPPPPSDSGTKPAGPPSFILNLQTTAPVSIVPGGLVHLTVNTSP